MEFAQSPFAKAPLDRALTDANARFSPKGGSGRFRSGELFFRVRTWGCSIESVTFTCEPQFAVISLVLEQLAQVCKHLSAVATDQDVRIACNIWKLQTDFVSSFFSFLAAF